MSFLTTIFYDRLMAKTEAACLRAWREGLLNQVCGEVLEVGAGTGANVEFYPKGLKRLVLSEPDRYMRKRIRAKLGMHGVNNAKVVDGTAEQLKFADESFDFVVTTLVCCSVASLAACMREIKRVLKPGGGLIFMEHVAAPDGTSRRRWQDRMAPLWRTIAGNCHLNRETEQAIVEGGFDIIQIERESMRKAPSIVRPTIRGLARKPHV